MRDRDACTICSNNYLAYATVFAESYKQHHPGAEVYACIVDRPDPAVRYGSLPFVAIFAEELGIPAFDNVAFRYDILELNTAVKPTFFSHLRDRLGLGQVLYFDPDVLVLDSLEPLWQQLDRHPVLLTPHITRPLDDSLRPQERLLLMAGVYNLGFIGLRFQGGTAELLDWWRDRLYRFCLNDLHQGLFVDQAWMGFAPAFVERLGVVRDPIYNVAYWNLPHRRPELLAGRWQIGGRRLGFFHFSGLPLEDLNAVSRHQQRLTLDSRPELLPLFAEYRRRLFTAGQERLGCLPYAYGRFRPLPIPIPPTARRALQRVDPDGRRFSDPFDLCRDDSFFSWLVEPLELRGGVLNRAVLSLWEERADLVRAFPQVFGGDLERYVRWLAQGEGQRAGFHPVFLAALRARSAAAGAARPTLGELHPYDATVADTGAEILNTVDLQQPGEMTGWLNEPVPGTLRGRPVITRLALLLHRQRPDVQDAYPDPLGSHQRQFAHWFAVDARREWRLHQDLVAPVVRSLSLRGRFSALPRRLRRRGGAAPVPAPAEPISTRVLAAAELPMPIPAPPRSDRRGPGGINLAGYFDGDTGVAQVGRGAVAALARTPVPLVRVPLGQDPWGKIVAGRIAQPQGAPYPVTLLYANADETSRALATLPVTACARGTVLACWFWELAHFPIGLTSAFDHVSEVWAPSQFCRSAFEALATVPVRWVPPCILRPTRAAGARSAIGLDEDRFYFFFSFDTRSVAERKNPLGAIEAIRLLAASSPRPVGLLLRVNHAREAPALVALLREAARGAPVVIHSAPAIREEIDAMIASCDACLSLHRSEGLGLLPIESLYLDKPVVATAYGGVTDFLDEGTGFPVAFALRRLNSSHGPYPAGAVWAEPDLDDAVASMQRLLADPAAATARAAAGRLRVEEIYGVEAAARRFESELQRVFAAAGCEPPAAVSGGDAAEREPAAASARRRADHLALVRGGERLRAGGEALR
jgi:glycosyltransferase involved in cell wall biosynthesis